MTVESDIPESSAPYLVPQSTSGEEADGAEGVEIYTE